MCLIVYIPTHAHPSIDRLQEAHKANPDGWGFMWAENSRLMIDKGIGFHLFEPRILSTMDAFPYSPFIVHFRTASMGRITPEACHPLKVNDNLAFCHNGNLFHFSDYFHSDGLTDSQRFCEWLKGHWCPAIIPDLERYCATTYNKVVFMDNSGLVRIINEPAGIWEGGCWYSNGGINNYVGYGYSGAYEYTKNDVRHKGGLISVQGYSGHWEQCGYCKGWFTKTESGLCPDCEAFNNV